MSLNKNIDHRGSVLITGVQRRKNDFAGRHSIEPYSGACCCCCCLHMMGAAVGGIPAIPIGWVTAARKDPRPRHPKTSLVLGLSLAGGIFLSCMMLVVGGFMADSRSIFEGMGQVIIFAALFVPSVVFLPVGPAMLLGTWIFKIVDPPADQDTLDSQSVYCRNCSYDLRGTMDSATCPECGAPLLKANMVPGMNYGIGIAWRITWMSLLFSSIGTGIGWLVMAPFMFM